MVETMDVNNGNGFAHFRKRCVNDHSERLLLLRFFFPRNRRKEEKELDNEVPLPAPEEIIQFIIRELRHDFQLMLM